LGSITSLTDSNGAAVNTYAYDAFGNQTASTGSLANPFRYTGREFDSETGLYYHRARYYDPQARRFLSEDPIGLAGGINMYAYVRNNPTTSIDPTGTLNSRGHRTVFVDAFPGLTTAEIECLMNGSNYVDDKKGYADYQPAHGMHDPRDIDGATSIIQTHEFIGARLNDAKQKRWIIPSFRGSERINVTCESLYYFGMAGHTIADFYYHNGRNGGAWSNTFSGDWVGHFVWEMETSMSPEQRNQAIQQIREMYLRVFGQSNYDRAIKANGR
jgi:RHS repeat-associated protein